MRGLAPWQGLILAAIVAPSVTLELIILAQAFSDPPRSGETWLALLLIPATATLFGGLNALAFLGLAFFIGSLVSPGKSTFTLAGIAAGSAHFWCGLLVQSNGVPAGLRDGLPTFFWMGFMDAAFHLPWWIKLASNLLAGWAAGSVYWWAIRRRIPPVIYIDPQAS